MSVYDTWFATAMINMNFPTTNINLLCQFHITWNLIISQTSFCDRFYLQEALKNNICFYFYYPLNIHISFLLTTQQCTNYIPSSDFKLRVGFYFVVVLVCLLSLSTSGSSHQVYNSLCSCGSLFWCSGNYMWCHVLNVSKPRTGNIKFAILS